MRCRVVNAPFVTPSSRISFASFSFPKKSRRVAVSAAITNPCRNRRSRLRTKAMFKRGIRLIEDPLAFANALALHVAKRLARLRLECLCKCISDVDLCEVSRLAEFLDGLEMPHGSAEEPELQIRFGVERRGAFEQLQPPRGRSRVALKLLYELGAHGVVVFDEKYVGLVLAKEHKALRM